MHAAHCLNFDRADHVSSRRVLDVYHTDVVALIFNLSRSSTSIPLGSMRCRDLDFPLTKSGGGGRAHATEDQLSLIARSKNSSPPDRDHG